MDGVRVVMDKTTVVVTVHGEVDVASADRVGPQLLAAATKASGTRCLIIDLREVTFLDSRGLHMLVCAHSDLGKVGVESFLVVKAGTVTARLFDITALRDVLAVHHRLGDALEAARRCVEGDAAAGTGFSVHSEDRPHPPGAAAGSIGQKGKQSRLATCE
jgi:anti-anti-sigma factor